MLKHEYLVARIGFDTPDNTKIHTYPPIKIALSTLKRWTRSSVMTNATLYVSSIAPKRMMIINMKTPLKHAENLNDQSQ